MFFNFPRIGDTSFSLSDDEERLECDIVNSVIKAWRLLETADCIYVVDIIFSKLSSPVEFIIDDIYREIDNGFHFNKLLIIYE